MAEPQLVHVVDDDAAVRRSLDRLLDVAGFKPVLYDTPLAFLAAAPGLTSGCILLDLRMPEMDGLDVLERLAERGNRLPVIVITGLGDVRTAVHAMKAGAVDFIEKPYSDEALVEAIRLAPSLLGQSNRDREAMEAAQRVATLTRRERQVLEALVAGSPNKVIAHDLGLSVRTVELHRARMMTRLGVQQFAEAVRIAVLASLARLEVPPAKAG
jgi:two-component system response regulator FixJ